MTMRYLILLFLSMPALADSLYWQPVTTDVYDRPLPGAVTYQIYQNGKAFGSPIAVAPTLEKPATVPSCVQHTYHVTARFAGQESKPSNTTGVATCIPSAPAVEKIENAKLLACRLENTKLTLAKMTVEGNLRACQARK